MCIVKCETCVLLNVIDVYCSSSSSSRKVRLQKSEDKRTCDACVMLNVIHV